MVLEKVKDIIEHNSGVPKNEIEINSHLYNELDLDSLDMAQIILALEKQYEIEISEEVLSEFKTVSNIVDFIEHNVAV
ncbi:acyl carrier protein [Clostridiaceae bacterium M8S5]|nr:acyl carrier protein [Clostridiaceae bacterium M8S5]